MPNEYSHSRLDWRISFAYISSKQNRPFRRSWSEVGSRSWVWIQEIGLLGSDVWLDPESAPLPVQSCHAMSDLSWPLSLSTAYHFIVSASTSPPSIKNQVLPPYFQSPYLILINSRKSSILLSPTLDCKPDFKHESSTTLRNNTKVFRKNTQWCY